MSIKSVTVYAASSQALDPVYVQAAGRLGRTLAEAGLEIVYGGGSTGLMGAMADGALAVDGRVHGIIPEFLTRVERGHQHLHTLEVVGDMRERKARMLEKADAVVALPGGCGTFEELFEAMTLKRLGQFLGPIVLVNTADYYDGLIKFLRYSTEQHFMNPAHLDLWQTVDEPEAVIEAIRRATSWSAREALATASVKPVR
ncbi:TIGR00730 family Rossman fold protein [Wenzhouxiangella sp. XN201]|uniref:LOG family protein n=1 Tax=Wenzhouxiangella sp. XN201 TaxID=2710755 RepID=UPI0013CCCB6E|nr:TIGR00730 family Rossman fold protein [Wenzhouxiangella sp. XN201]NEZ04446.1 TIGR00730 family Rossman fold protein [Wenzhouxiangella sp. XN201]